MSIKLSEVIPLGRRASEYIEMFGLTREEQCLKILDCGGGPSSFNAEMTALGGRVVSADPLYQYSKERIKERFDATFEDIMLQTERNRESFVWKIIKDPDDLRKRRRSASEIFLEDYDRGKIHKRYVGDELPMLSFGEKQFDIALCSHFLFLYDHVLTLDFHIKAISEMLRVAGEIRIFPLQNLDVTKSSHLDSVVEKFAGGGYEVETVKVKYEFQKGSNEFLRIR